MMHSSALAARRRDSLSATSALARNIVFRGRHMLASYSRVLRLAFVIRPCIRSARSLLLSRNFVNSRRRAALRCCPCFQHTSYQKQTMATLTQACCTLPPVQAKYESKGKVTKVGDMEVYEAKHDESKQVNNRGGWHYVLTCITLSVGRCAFAWGNVRPRTQSLSCMTFLDSIPMHSKPPISLRSALVRSCCRPPALCVPIIPCLSSHILSRGVRPLHLTLRRGSCVYPGFFSRQTDQF